MSESKQKIRAFATAGRAHLNAGQRERAALFAGLAFGALALVMELGFLVRGQRVAPLWLLIPLLMATAVALICFARFRYSHLRAIGHLDQFFNLKEGLVTADEHLQKERTEAMHELQIKHTADHLAQHDPAAARPQVSRRAWGLTGAGVLLVAALLCIDDSAAVKAAQLEEETTQALSAEVAEELKESFQEMLDSVDPELKEMLKDPALKEAVEQFEGGGDRRAVMRALSEISRELSKKSAQFDTRADESYLKELAEQLSRGRETAEVGKALSQGDYKKAASAMENMQLSDDASAAEREALEKMAARIGEAEKSMSNNESGSRRAANEMSREIKKMAEECQKGSCSKESKAGVNKAMENAGKQMRQVQAKSEAASAIEKLQEQLRKGQSKMSQSSAQGQPQNGSDQSQTGPGWGEGVDRSRRQATDDSAEGQMEHLSGLLGEGESEKVIENALSGTGTSSGAGQQQGAVNYAQQVEAFVRRDDVPEAMKHGVKSYFERIHELEERINEGASDGQK